MYTFIYIYTYDYNMYTEKFVQNRSCVYVYKCVRDYFGYALVHATIQLLAFLPPRQNVSKVKGTTS